MRGAKSVPKAGAARLGSHASARRSTGSSARLLVVSAAPSGASSISWKIHRSASSASLAWPARDRRLPSALHAGSPMSYLPARFPHASRFINARATLRSGQPRRGFSNGRRGEEEAEEPLAHGGEPSRRRVEVNLSESTDQVVLGYAKKYARKVAIEWPLQGLKYGALGLLAAGGAGYMAVSALAQKARSLFGGKNVVSYDPAAAKKNKGEGFFSRLIKDKLQETLALEVSRTMSTIVAINQDFKLRRELGGDMTVDLENLIDRSNYINTEEAKKHPRFEIKTVRTWEYDELWIVSQTGKRARLCVQAYLDEKEDLERENEEMIRKRREKKRRKKEGLPPLEEEPAKKEEKKYDWKFVHISAFFDDDTRQLVIIHDEEEAGKDIRILPDAEWSDEEYRPSTDTAGEWEDDEGAPKHKVHATFIDAEVVEPKKTKRRK